ncbi:MAG: exodeoxyribonuclease III [Pseudanabaenaceae cyanobacterium bins.68]|nr:exodeoxyribonuclease III [Pseudanabaenaceae cyanobacterium bins.68]
MQVATWNVNSIRTRLDQVITWLAANPKLDILCLQETKVVDPDFPLGAFEQLGWHLQIYGQKSYNGVAIASRQPLAQVRLGFGAVLPELAELDQQKRLICGVYGGVTLVNLYIPNGAEVGSAKYEYKLQWLAALQTYLAALRPTTPDLLVCGDFNVAPADLDIYNPKGREQKVMATDLERNALAAALPNFQDAFRKFAPDGGHYSWWDYRSGGFARNRGWRIDHHYLSQSLYQRAIACWIDLEPRRQPQPSDHTPVIVELD